MSLPTYAHATCPSPVERLSMPWYSTKSDGTTPWNEQIITDSHVWKKDAQSMLFSTQIYLFYFAI